MRLRWIMMVVAVVMVCGVAGVGEASGQFEIILEGFKIYDLALEGNSIWCTTSSKGILQYNLTDGLIQQYTKDDGLLSNTYYSVAIDQEGTKWFGESFGISKYDGITWTHYRKTDTIEFFESITDIAVDSENTVWFTSSHTLIMLKDDKWTTFFPKRFNNIFVDHNDTKWFAGNMERAFYNNQGLTDIKNDENDDMYYHWVAIDRNDVQFWSDAMVLRIIDGDNTISYGGMGTTAFALDHNNILWIGDSVYGLWKHENNELSRVLEISTSQVWDIEIDEDGAIWMALEKGSANGILAKYTPDRTTTAVQTEQPEILSIIESYPNPFNAQTTLSFELPSESMTTLAVYDITGRKLRELLTGDIRAGRHSVLWDGKDGDGVSVGSGLYFSRLSAGGGVATGRMLFLK